MTSRLNQINSSPVGKVLLKLLCFMVPLAGLVLLIERRVLPRVGDSYRQLQAEITKKSPDVEIVITGSSHEQVGIDPRLMPRTTINFANSVQSLYYDTRLLTKYARQAPKLKLVIMGISYWSFQYQMWDSAEPWRSHFYPGSATDHRLLTLARGRARVEQIETTMHPVHIAENLQMLEESLSQMKERNIQVVFITSPVHWTFQRYTHPEYYDQMHTLLSNLCREYGAVYYDYSSDTRFTDDDFANVDHLNSAGPQKLTQILNAEVIKSEDYCCSSGLYPLDLDKH